MTCSTGTPRRTRSFAVKAATGAHLWTFDSGIRRRPEPRRSCTGRAAASGACSPPSDNFIYALDAATGKPIETFGTAGRIDFASISAAIRRRRASG